MRVGFSFAALVFVAVGCGRSQPMDDNSPLTSPEEPPTPSVDCPTSPEECLDTGSEVTVIELGDELDGVKPTEVGEPRLALCTEGPTWVAARANGCWDCDAPPLRIESSSGEVLGRYHRSVATALVEYSSVIAPVPCAGRWDVVVPGGTDGWVRTGTPPGTSEPDSMEAPSVDASAGFLEGRAGFVGVAHQASSIRSVGVYLEEPGDVDWIRIPRPTDGPIELWVTTADESPVRARVRLFDPDGNEVHEAEGLHPTARLTWWTGGPGDWTLAVEDAAGGGGEAYWLGLHVRTWEMGTPGYDDVPWEEEPNPPEKPQSLGFPGAGDLPWAVQGRLEGEGDVDAFEIPGLEVGQDLCMSCSAWGYGSSTPMSFEVDGSSITEDPTRPGEVQIAGNITDEPPVLTVRSADHHGEHTYYFCRMYQTEPWSCWID